MCQKVNAFKNDYKSILSLNRSESAVLARIFAGYLFNDHIFQNHEGLKALLELTFPDLSLFKENPLPFCDYTYFLKPRDLIRKKPGDTNDCKLNQIMSQGHFDIACSIENGSIENGSDSIDLVLFETKYLSDIIPSQLLQQVELCNTLKQQKLYFNDGFISIGSIKFITICTYTNLHYTRALTVNSQNRVTVSVIDKMMPEWVRIITWDTVVQAILKSQRISESCKISSKKILMYIHACNDAKSLTAQGIPKSSYRHLINNKNLIEKFSDIFSYEELEKGE